MFFRTKVLLINAQSVFLGDMHAAMFTANDSRGRGNLFVGRFFSWAVKLFQYQQSGNNGNYQ